MIGNCNHRIRTPLLCRFFLQWRRKLSSANLPEDGLTLQDFLPQSEGKGGGGDINERRTGDGRLRLPEWLKRDVVAKESDVNRLRLKRQLRGLKLSTVCEVGEGEGEANNIIAK